MGNTFWKTKNVSDLKVPESFKKFLFKDVLPNYIIYSQKEKYAYCTACQSEIDIKMLGKTRPKAETKCPVCKANTILKAKGQTNYQFQDSGVGIMLDKDEDICIRYFDTIKVYHPDGTVFRHEYWECLREYYNENGDKVTFENSFGKGWHKCNIRKVANIRGSIGSTIIKINTNWNYIKFYTRNMSKVTKETPWQYSMVNKIFTLPHKDIYWDSLSVFLKDYLICPINEYLYKIGFKKIVTHSTFVGYFPIDPKAKTITGILKLSKDNYKELLKIGNPSFVDLRTRQIMTKYRLSESDLSIWGKYFSLKDEIYGYRWSSGNAAADLIAKYNKKSWYQLDKYLKDNPEIDLEYKYHHGHKMTLDDYADYLKMCNELGYNMKNTFIVFPKHFKDANINVTAEWNLKNNAEKREEAKKRNGEYEEYRKKYSELYTFEEDNLKIVVPNGCDDICAEGQNLRHCVGTYIDRVCKGISVILFVRQIKDLEKSFYTMELRDNKMIQVRGFSNGTVTPEVRTFIEDFAKAKNITMQNIA